MSSVEPFAFRLTRGADLKQSILDAVKTHQIQAGCVASLVGCLSELKIRVADGKSTLSKIEPFEILSVSGTLTPEHVHLHISVADEQGAVTGGHLMDGCVVSHTAEVCLLKFDGYGFSREHDPDTGYTELVVSKD
ncbi:DNA-binding protein [Grimontia sp. AD028]|uniref:PPC domain-containing DNA-binding protein n=1 Tax=Grimontia sp. AD028 TaxID=1581149 RepID=UPI00061AC897|nr:PPC domain-containing DNA-binding protein [Grimontia sp. AD028]KKD62486.1 DNA-binding protein [Grimontia sp. AD028]